LFSSSSVYNVFSRRSFYTLVIGSLQQACVEEREEETRENRGNEYVKGGVHYSKI